MKSVLSIVTIFISVNVFAGTMKSIASFSLEQRHAQDPLNAARLGKLIEHKVPSRDLTQCRPYLLWCGTSGVIHDPDKICDLAKKQNAETNAKGGYGTEGFGYGASNNVPVPKDSKKFDTEIHIGMGWNSDRIISLKTTIDASGKFFKAKNIKAELYKLVGKDKGTWSHNKHYSPAEYKRLTSFFDLALYCDKDKKNL